MFYLDDDIHEFYKRKTGRTLDTRYKICMKCNKEVNTGRAFVTKDYYGIQFDTHEPCGPQYRITMYIPKDPNWLDKIELECDDDCLYDEGDEYEDA